MKRLLLVLDFDGTFTDVEVEGAPFVDHYKEALAGLLGRDVERLWAEAEETLGVAENGWNVNGRIVAPANCDPYIRSTCVAFAICDRLALLPDIKLRTDVLSALYAHCYAYTTTAFRPEAKGTLDRLKKSGAVVRVVTNSDTAVVAKKLAALGAESVPVMGNAKKYFVDPGDASVSDLSDIKLPGLERPLLVRRPHYQLALERLWSESETTAAQTLVCGDIFELDLALPLARGTLGHLLLRPNMLPYEREIASRYGDALTSSSSLDALAERVEGLLA